MSEADETRVLFINRQSEELLNYIRRGLGDLPITLSMPVDDDEDSLLELVPQAHIIIGWSSGKELLRRAGQMKLFINPGAGVSQHIEAFREARTDRELLLANGHGNSYAVAQHTVALLLSLTNKVIPHHIHMAGAGQGRPNQRTTYLKGITIGLLGYGAIGSKVHKFLSGFEVDFARFRL